MKTSVKIARNIFQLYSARCKPLCREIGMPQTAFDILMFFANNPEYDTARDIDRRKVRLVCTEKAWPVVERGRQLQDHFMDELFQNVDGRLKDDFFRVLNMMENNLKTMREGQG